MKEFIRKIVDRFDLYDAFNKYWVPIIIVAVLGTMAFYYLVFSSLLSSSTIMTWLHTPVTAMQIKDICIIAFIAAFIAK
jgi:hypothetical protein